MPRVCKQRNYRRFSLNQEARICWHGRVPCSADTRVVKAHDAAVAHTLNYIEGQLTKARQKDHGKTRIEQTDNLIVVTFRHETARPTPDAPPEPNLHTHAIIMNAIQRKDGIWVALSNELIV